MGADETLPPPFPAPRWFPVWLLTFITAPSENPLQQGLMSLKETSAGSEVDTAKYFELVVLAGPTNTQLLTFS